MSRFVISGVDIRGFKSVGRQTLSVDFGSASLVGIVGHNGSGKSNILDAIAFCVAPSSNLRVGSLVELRNSDEAQVCEVVLHIADSSGRNCHEIRCVLSPDSTRIHHVDGKLKTAKAVKDFLRSKGLFLDGSLSLIQQAQVTKLADKNSPKDIALIIEQTSGLLRWKEETGQASDELVKTRKALEDVSRNVAKMERAVADDEETFKELTRLEQIVREVSVKVCELATALILRTHMEKKRATALETEANEVKCEVDRAKEEINNIKNDIKGLESLVEDADVDNTRTTQLKKDIAKHEEMMNILKRRFKENDDAAAMVAGGGYRLEQMGIEKEALEQDLELQNRSIANIEKMIGEARKKGHDMASAERLEALKKGISDLETRMADVVREEKQAASGAECARKSLSEATHRLKIIEKGEPSKADFTGPLITIEAKMRADSDKLRAAQRDLKDAQSKAQVWSTTLENILGRGSKHMRRLYQCFRLNHPDLDGGRPAEGLLCALNLIAGSKLGVAVVPTTAAAAELVGSVWLPMDLMTWNEGDRCGILRAFGGYLIASNDTVASTLAQRDGLSSVTLDGKISTKGSLTGGWVPARPNSKNVLSMKRELDVETRKASILVKEVRKLEKDLEQQDASVQHLRDQARQAQGWKTKLDQARQDASRFEVQVRGAESSVARIRATLDKLEKEVDNQKKILKMMKKGEGSACMTAMETERKAGLYNQDLLKARISELDSAVGDLEAAIDQAEAKQLDINKKNRMREEIALHEEAVHRLRLELENIKGQEKEQNHQKLELRSKLENLRNQLKSSRSALQCLEKQMAALKKASLDCGKRIGTLQQELQLLKDKDGDASHEAENLSEKKMEGGNVDVTDAAVKRLRNELKASEGEKASMKIKHIPESAQVIYKQRKDAIETFQQRARSLREASDVLEAGIGETKRQVLETNERVFQTVNTLFLELCSKLMPQMVFSLQLVSADLLDGVVIAFRKQNDREWNSRLEQLSGGQRTLISLALLMAAAKSGGQTNTFLMDEDLSMRGGFQIVCVSHNIAFQKLCDMLIQVTKSNGVTEVVKSIGSKRQKR
ncbi:hypothetical protein BSKO_05064 [Bryopsis sp. KO-2023]|nr:hypothetical protein BSKO_05064 [Bryopsis sp. KO-2023]